MGCAIAGSEECWRELTNSSLPELDDQRSKPEAMANFLAIPWGNHVFQLPKHDGLFKAIEAYTIYFAAERGGQKTMKVVRDLFATGKPEEALAAAMKL
ncbi:hypothetical protein ON010_g11529 [Phytophthora cinnamomi]|nr:hypothetical protein ON010_g11529 [Phytophthora cinnamomi]